MIDMELLEEGLCFFVNSILPGWEPFFTVDQKSRPKAPCVEISLTTLRELGTSMSTMDNDGYQRQLTEYELTYTFKAFGNYDGVDRLDPMAALANLTNENPIFYDTPPLPVGYSSRHLLTITTILKNETGLSILRSTPVSDISGINDTVYEPRAQRQIIFSGIHRGDLVQTGFFETVEGDAVAVKMDDTYITIPILINS